MADAVAPMATAVRPTHFHMTEAGNLTEHKELEPYEEREQVEHALRT
jgi:hypothetical protein